MFKNLLRIPDTFDPDDRRRRQILNVLLIIFILGGIFTTTLTLFYYGWGGIDPHSGISSMLILGGSILSIAINTTLLFTNRSSKMPSWLTSAMFIALLMALLTQVDTPQELYNGRSLVAWVVPIMVSTVILPPGSVFVVITVIFGLMEIFPPPNQVGVNYYAMLTLLVIAFLCWLGMRIANRAIRDARRQAANNEATLNSIADGVLVLDLEGNFLSANPALRRMIPEKNLQEIMTKPLGKTLQWKNKVFSVTASPVPEVGTVAIVRDETRRHETERARDALIATASHELRTPLAAIMNYLELLLMRVKLDKLDMEEFKDHLSRALENSKRLQSLIDNILDQAQIQAGMLELKNQRFNLQGLLEKTRQLLEILITEKMLSYELSIAQDVPAEIVGDPDRLHQVLVNLIGNAIKFTNQGSIKVHVSAPQKEKLSIQVIDSGPGIPPEQLPDIFEAFRRGSNYAQRERQGAGLGLSIAKEIVIRMGGEIFVASEHGVGSTFTFVLPVEET